MQRTFVIGDKFNQVRACGELLVVPYGKYTLQELCDELNKIANNSVWSVDGDRLQAKERTDL